MLPPVPSLVDGTSLHEGQRGEDVAERLGFIEYEHQRLARLHELAQLRVGIEELGGLQLSGMLIGTSTGSS